MRRVIGLAIAGFAAFVLFYLSRFWIFSLWPRDGLLGFKFLPPQGGLVGRWLRGTDFSAFELLIWAVLAFLLLTLVQKLWDRTTG